MIGLTWYEVEGLNRLLNRAVIASGLKGDTEALRLIINQGLVARHPVGYGLRELTEAETKVILEAYELIKERKLWISTFDERVIRQLQRAKGTG
jgi:hypothetical protein